jgi:transposase InsO family protein
VADLATGRAESAEEATETRPYVVNEGSCVRRAWATRAYLARAGVHDLVIDAFVFEEALGRSDNGPEFAAKAVRHWLGRVGVKTLFVEPGSSWEKGYCESFNSKLRDELLNGDIFTSSTKLTY